MNRPSPAREFFDHVLAMESWPEHECIEWPFSRNAKGYGSVWVPSERKMQQVHRLACAHLHGPAPEGLVARHRCIGNPSCFNPRHVVWGTHSENSRDRAEHGTEQRGELAFTAKLTREQVIAIRQEVGPNVEVAERYGVHRTQVMRIRKGESWSWLT